MLNIYILYSYYLLYINVITCKYSLSGIKIIIIIINIGALYTIILSTLNSVNL